VIVGLTVIKTIHDMYPKDFAFKASHFDLLIGNDWVRRDIENGVPVAQITRHWQQDLARFKRVREKYLFYR
jgi:uncharacterized protein YbbC (DUF1343 family)